MKYYVKYVKETRCALIEKTKEFDSEEKALKFARKHRTLEVWKLMDDQTKPYIYDWDTEYWYCV